MDDELTLVVAQFDDNMMRVRKKRLGSLLHGLSLSYDGVKVPPRRLRKQMESEDPIYLFFDGPESATKFVETAGYYIHPEFVPAIRFSVLAEGALS